MVDESIHNEESALVTRSRQGDLGAFDELVTRHRNRIYMTAYQIVRNEDDAWDIAQDTFLRAWKSLSKFDGKGSFSGWLSRIATNAGIDHLRKRQRHPEVEYDESVGEAAADHAREADFSLDRADLKQRLDAAIGSLSPEHRMVIILKEIESLSYREIADRMHCTIGTVMSRLFYARKKLQTKLRDLHE